MAKSARSAQTKANNRRLKSKVFGPVEAARNERLSAKLQELAAAPKPEREDDGKMTEDEDTKTAPDTSDDPVKDSAMELDNKAPSQRSSKNRIEKKQRHSRSKSKHVFTTWKKGKKTGGGRK